MQFHNFYQHLIDTEKSTKLISIQIQVKKSMSKNLYITLLTSIIILITQSQQNLRYYFSPLGTTLYQVQDTLDIISSTFSIPQTTFTRGQGQGQGVYNLTLTNIMVTLTYMKQYQQVDITRYDYVNVTNGRIQANFRFNFSRSQTGTAAIRGWGQGFKFVSEDISYSKYLTFQYGYLVWALGKNIQPILFNGKRNPQPQTLYPYSQSDLDIINYIFTQNQSVTPSSILSQLNTFLNPAFINQLKHSINPPQLSIKPYTYTFNHPQHGNMSMQTLKYLYYFQLYPEGFSIGFLLHIGNQQDSQEICQYSKMPDRLDQKYFGGQQAIYHKCLLEQVVQYMYKKGWLNLEIDHTWNTAEFAFTVSNFAKIVPSLLNKFSPALPVKGICESLPPQPNQTIKVSPGVSIVLDHTCKFYVFPIEQHISPELFLQFTSKVQIIVDISQHYDKMSVSFQGSELINLVNHKVKDYQVNDAALLKYFHKVMNSLVGTRLFGDGFAMLKSKKEQTRAFENYVVYSDMNFMGIEQEIVVQ